MAFDGFDCHLGFEFFGKCLAFHSALQDSEFILTDCLVFGVHYNHWAVESVTGSRTRVPLLN